MRLVAIRREHGRWGAVGELDLGFRPITPRRAVEVAFEQLRLRVGDRVTLGNGQTWEITAKAARLVRRLAP